MQIFLWLICYIVGSIPFGLLVTWAYCRIDIRHVGSANIGATNVARIIGKKFGALVFVLDGLKGALPTLVVQQIFNSQQLSITAASASIFGHIFPVFLKFKGGKGVSTAMACFIVIDYRVGITTVVSWCIARVFTKYVFLTSIFAMLITIMLSLCMMEFKYLSHVNAYFFIFLCCLVIMRHYSNIKRFIRGQELAFKI